MDPRRGARQPTVDDILGRGKKEGVHEAAGDAVLDEGFVQSRCEVGKRRAVDRSRAEAGRTCALHWRRGSSNVVGDGGSR